MILKEFKTILPTLLIMACLTSCNQENRIKDYISIKGKINNINETQLKLLNNNNQRIKTITIETNGIFEDTLNISKGIYTISNSDGSFSLPLFLKKGDNLTISFDFKNLNKTLSFNGQGSQNNYYLQEKVQLQSQLFNEVNDLYSLSKNDFEKALKEKKRNALLKNVEYQDLDTTLINEIKKGTDYLFNYFNNNYDHISKINNLKGKKSPEFINFENNNGSVSSLKDFKGHYIFIDVWATWCKPCWQEFPYLKKLEKEFQHDDIKFISISVDKNSKHATWKKAISKNNLSGIQLFADEGLKSAFIKGFYIQDIPRFIIIDKNGYVVDPHAPRPSDPKLKAVLIKLIHSM